LQISFVPEKSRVQVSTQKMATLAEILLLLRWLKFYSSKSFHANFATVNWTRLTNGFLPHPFQHIPKVWHCCTDFDKLISNEQNCMWIS